MPSAVPPAFTFCQHAGSRCSRDRVNGRLPDRFTGHSRVVRFDIRSDRPGFQPTSQALCGHGRRRASRSSLCSEQITSQMRQRERLNQTQPRPAIPITPIIVQTAMSGLALSAIAPAMSVEMPTVSVTRP